MTSSSSLILLAPVLAEAGSRTAAARNDTKCGGSARCKDGVILPPWRPEDPELPDRVARAAIYLVGLAYMFLGVSIIADRFMASIEVITSQEREITVQKANGEKLTTTVRIWNETVSNLTLMALGSSAPEILLSVVEVCGHNFDAGELGPNTIVGSAAFNMFVIIGICVYVIPDGESRRVKHLRVFFVTAAWSVFAYTWLYLILAYFSPGVVEIWEGLLTLFFFPVCVGFAYVADRRLLFYKYVYKRHRAGKRRGVIVETEGEPELPREAGPKNMAARARDPDRAEPGSERATPIPPGTADIPREASPAAHPDRDDPQRSESGRSARVFFHPARYRCSENCGSVALTVIRDGDLSSTVAVDFRTQDGTAKAAWDFRSAEGTLVFGAGETRKEIRVDIVDDDIFEEEEHFLVHLSGARVLSGGGGVEAADGDDPALPRTATVAIFDDDHAGVFTFEEPTVTVSESVGVMEIRVVRTAGARGAVAVPYRTIEGTAKGGGEDFEDTRGVLRFDDDEICQTLRINIVDDEAYEKNKKFWVEMDEPRLLEMSRRKAVLLQDAGGGFLLTDKPLFGKEPVYGKLQREDQREPSSVRTISEEAEDFGTNEEDERRIARTGRPALGQHVKLEVVIEESYEFKNAVDKVLKKTRLAVLVGTTSWREQLAEAVTIGPGDDDDDDDNGGGKKPPSALDYAIHFLTVFWKLLFALVPPTDYWNGWACFVVSIAVIGLLTALIGDLASHFGCTVGLKDSVTAVVFVALGTSVPDTFASKVAACQDQYADASIGNVTGSNAVIGGELGGPPLAKTATAGLFFSLWLTYVVLSSLEAYCHIPGF
ncbi:LOW QUALITY PROTEIN: sodium/calcium exchanger 1-like [Hippocampus comes]|uniref:LOW QUALITY PROTEIN: sodium/calcium exchanger 1-like n=1 Tax=Hippocampus comes TaxID=109280 RepID=UPI00094F3959|nr:PREDICTED: LOW QUALITY PROTEIN: sodium/calcium exchanger 1-like [Hippocampus comes]